ncbi:uncharacterized protein NESG_01433 [Nematocida ausubeli]|uniref:Mitochondrial import inner membrane translocase subunit TIM50 n=1 Tax=Nematocida ausubeli (strain ATCC PRA-371 / ERTm2) TaxID=1913371 RepID=A0A086J2E5_NEMA1|nr:uncharacterized protein NESG_01433 [Nematocida ausubeli]KFG26313.1 hypothetical protein NESG_01433 [Nematocida ausubeli]
MTVEKKIFVFDLNGTLLSRVKENKGTYLDKKKPDAIIPGRGDLIYLRPHLDKLINYLHENDITYMLWTTAMEHNGIHLTNLLESKGMTRAIHKYYHAHATKLDENSYKRGKDMNKIAELENVSVKNVFLIDDEIIKCIPESSYIPIEEYQAMNEEDDALIRIIERIKICNGN